MAKESAGILLYRMSGRQAEVLLVHPGGPFFRNKDMGSWTIPKGELMEGEEALAAAVREFAEETGYTPDGDFISLGAIQQKGGKRVICWAVKGNMDASAIVSNLFTIAWPPRSGKQMQFPEIDRAAWFRLEEARRQINERQVPFLDRLEALL